MATYSYRKDASGNVIEYKDGVATGGSSNTGYKYQNGVTGTTGGTSTGTTSSVAPTYTGATASKPTTTGSVVPGAYKDSNGNWVTTTSVNRTYTTDSNGNTVLDPTKTDTWTQKSYLSENPDLQYAMQQYAKGKSDGVTVGDYVSSLYNRIGTNRADGSSVTLADINKELDRLGLSDYNSNNVIYTAGGTYLPGGDTAKLYGRESYGDEGITVNGSPQNGRYYSYGGQTYLMPTDGKYASPYADLSQMANLMAKNYLKDANGDYVRDANGNPVTYNNISNGDLLFGNMGMNSMIAGDANAQAQYAAMMNNLGQYMGGATIGSTGAGLPLANGNYTNNANVNSAINYINNAATYAQATGNNNLLQSINDLMSGNMKSMQDYIALQKQQAEANAEQQAQSAYLSNLRAQNTMKDQMAAQGLGTSGAMQSAQLGLQADYGNNIATINQNLSSMLSNLSQQELQALADYYNTMTDYTYKINRDNADDAYRNQQLSMQQEQMRLDEAYRQQQLAQQLAQFEWQKQQADRNASQNAAEFMYGEGGLSGQGLANVYDNLGILGNGWFSNGLANNGVTATQLGLTKAQLENQALKAEIAKDQAYTSYYNRR